MGYMTMSPPPADPGGQHRPLPQGGYQVTEAPAQGPRPRAVDIAFWLWVTYLAIGASNVVVGFVHRDRNRTEAINVVVAQYPGMERSVIESIATVVVVGVVVVGLLLVAACSSFAFLMRGGHNWARIVLTVVGGLSILFVIGPVATPMQALFQFLLLAAAILMMFQRPANEWFRLVRPRL